MPKATISTRNFRRQFESKKPIDSVAYLMAAHPMIVEEVAKLINGKENQLIELAEYMVSNVTPSDDSFEIFDLLAGSYGFVGRYADSWETIVKYQPAFAVRQFRAYRTVLPKLSIPAHALAPYGYVPEVDPESWTAEDGSTKPKRNRYPCPTNDASIVPR